jgi:fermentation-respiration switch protein FrsA (DUF1100 family)
MFLRMRRSLLRLLLVPFLVLIAVAGGVFLYRTYAEARRLLTNPLETRMRPARTPGSFGLPFRDVRVTTPDGLTLVGWWVPSNNGAAVIAQHGYKASRGEMLNEAVMLHRLGFGVLLSTLRAHDESEGDLITLGRLEMDDLAAWYAFVRREPSVDPARIGLLGNSLGGTLAIQFAAQTPAVAAVVAHSPFSSLPDTLETSVRFFTGLPPFPFAPMIAFWAERMAGISIADVDAKRWIARLSPRPVLLLQGGADVVVSPDGGQRLFEAAREPKELWFDPKVGHAAFDGVRAVEYERRVGGFFDRYLRGDGVN